MSLTSGGAHLQVGVLLVGEWHVGSGFHLLLVLLENSLVDLDFWGSEGWCGDELKRLVTDQLAGEPEEGLLEVVVGLGGNVVVLEVFLAMESDGLGFDFALLDIDLVAAENDGDALADTNKITVPVGDVLVCDPSWK